MLAERRTPQHEYYAAILNDRATQGPVLVTSRQGGMNIEEVAASDPDAIITTPIDFKNGLDKDAALTLAKKLGFEQRNQEQAAQTFVNLYKIFKEKDATQIEINPLAETSDGAVLWCVIYGVVRMLVLSIIVIAWMPNSGSTTMQNSDKRKFLNYEMYRRKPLRKSKLLNTASTSSNWTVILDVLSTVRV